MKYKLSIITRFSWSCDFLQKQLNFLFGDLFNITCHSPNTTPVIPIFNADLILLHEPSALVEMQKYIKSDCPLILMRRTITSEALEKIKKLPSGITAAVINATDYMAHETMTNIYQLGIKNITLIPWAPDSHRKFPNVDIVISHRVYDFLPNIQTEITLLGSRVITADVIVDVISYFNVDSQTTDQIFNRYMSIVPSFQKGVHSLHENNKFLSAQWNLLYDKINICVAVITSNNLINSYNTHFAKLIEPFNKPLITLEDLINLRPQLSLLKSTEEIEEEVIEIIGQKYILNVNYLDISNHLLGKIVRLEPYNQVVQTHQNIHQKIIGDGHIAKYKFEDIIGKDDNITFSKKLGRKFAHSDFPVLIFGESGTGKELISSAIHNESSRKDSPFVAVNCAGIPDALLESEFFGYEGSAFTGAKKSGSIGLFEKAHKGTLFLDEISELPYPLQGKLLRAIQEQEIRKVGSTQTISVDVRIIAATNKNLESLISAGQFRSDLFYRLNVFSLSLPPLRKRDKDIKLLCDYFISAKGHQATELFYSFTEKYNWPGNIRELKNVIEYMSVVCEGPLDIKCLPEYIKSKNIINISNSKNNDEVTKLFLLKSISECKANGVSTGRRNLSSYITMNYFSVSESEVRKLLTELEKNNYISIKKGRTGCELTVQGEEYILQLKI